MYTFARYLQSPLSFASANSRSLLHFWSRKCRFKNVEHSLRFCSVPLLSLSSPFILILCYLFYVHENHLIISPSLNRNLFIISFLHRALDHVQIRASYLPYVESSSLFHDYLFIYDRLIRRVAGSVLAQHLSTGSHTYICV